MNNLPNDFILNEGGDEGQEHCEDFLLHNPMAADPPSADQIRAACFLLRGDWLLDGQIFQIAMDVIWAVAQLSVETADAGTPCPPDIPGVDSFIVARAWDMVISHRLAQCMAEVPEFGL